MPRDHLTMPGMHLHSFPIVIVADAQSCRERTILKRLGGIGDQPAAYVDEVKRETMQGKRRGYRRAWDAVTAAGIYTQETPDQKSGRGASATGCPPHLIQDAVGL